jgi:hypothetical protein
MDLEKGTLKDEPVEEEGQDLTHIVLTLVLFITMMWKGDVFIAFLVLFVGGIYVSWDNPLVRRKVYGWVMCIALLALFTWSLLHREPIEIF